MNNVSWGTRDVTIIRKPKNEKVDKKEEKKTFRNNLDNTESTEFSLRGLFKLLCCTSQKNANEEEILKNTQDSIKLLKAILDAIENKCSSPDVSNSRKLAGTVQIEGPDASRVGNEPSEEDDDGVPKNVWFYEGELEKGSVEYLDRKEEIFWEKFIKRYLEPIDDSDKKEEITKNLKDLKDKMVVTFFMLNSMFVLVILLLNMHQDVIHLHWPFNPKVNFSYSRNPNEIIIHKTYIQLQPIGFVFLFAFALVMIIQFFAMFVHRFETFSQIMANTNISLNLFATNNLQNITTEKNLEQDSIKIIKKMFKLQRINDDEEDQKERPVGRRDTAYFAALKKTKKPKPPIEDLEDFLKTRLEKIRTGEIAGTNLGIPRHMLDGLFSGMNVQRRQTETPNNSVILEPMPMSQ